MGNSDTILLIVSKHIPSFCLPCLNYSQVLLCRLYSKPTFSSLCLMLYFLTISTERTFSEWINTGVPVAVIEGNKNIEIPFDLTQLGLQLTTTSETAGKLVAVSFTDGAGTAILTLQLDLHAKTYIMAGKGNANCVSSAKTFLVWPTETSKTWTLWKSDVSLVLECDGQVVAVHRIVDSGACEKNFETPIKAMKIETADTATVTFSTVSE